MTQAYVALYAHVTMAQHAPHHGASPRSPTPKQLTRQQTRLGAAMTHSFLRQLHAYAISVLVFAATRQPFLCRTTASPRLLSPSRAPTQPPNHPTIQPIHSDLGCVDRGMRIAAARFLCALMHDHATNQTAAAAACKGAGGGFTVENVRVVAVGAAFRKQYRAL